MVSPKGLVTELPFWKAHPNWQPLDPSPFALTEENLKKVQKEWADAPNAEEIIAFLTLNLAV